jgi:two-component system, OmpR family, response regulator MtrA
VATGCDERLTARSFRDSSLSTTSSHRDEALAPIASSDIVDMAGSQSQRPSTVAMERVHVSPRLDMKRGGSESTGRRTPGQSQPERDSRRYEAVAATLTNRGANRLRRVLVVDDDAATRNLLMVTFDLPGFTVSAASDGIEALDSVRALPPDVVVLDIMMPRLDGIRTLGAMKARKDLRDIPVILLSAKAQSTDIELGFRVGAADYVVKPFDPEDLVARTRRAMTSALTVRRHTA